MRLDRWIRDDEGGKASAFDRASAFAQPGVVCSTLADGRDEGRLLAASELLGRVLHDLLEQLEGTDVRRVPLHAVELDGKGGVTADLDAMRRDDASWAYASLARGFESMQRVFSVAVQIALLLGPELVDRLDVRLGRMIHAAVAVPDARPDMHTALAYEGPRWSDWKAMLLYGRCGSFSRDSSAAVRIHRGEAFDLLRRVEREAGWTEEMRYRARRRIADCAVPRFEEPFMLGCTPSMQRTVEYIQLAGPAHVGTPPREDVRFQPGL